MVLPTPYLYSVIDITVPPPAKKYHPRQASTPYPTLPAALAPNTPSRSSTSTHAPALSPTSTHLAARSSRSTHLPTRTPTQSAPSRMQSLRSAASTVFDAMEVMYTAPAVCVGGGTQS